MMIKRKAEEACEVLEDILDMSREQLDDVYNLDIEWAIDYIRDQKEEIKKIREKREKELRERFFVKKEIK